MVGQRQESIKVGIAGHHDPFVCSCLLEDLIILGSFQSDLKIVHGIVAGFT